MSGGDVRLSVQRCSGRATMLALAVAAALAAAGCSHLPRIHAPWSHRPVPPPRAVQALRITNAAGAPAPFPQYWSRNTLVIDLRGISGSGRLVIEPPPGMTWPFRMALRVVPGSVGELDIRGDQRLVIPIAPGGAQPVDLPIAPSLYARATRVISVAWRPPSAH